jgi:hypothetical protein
MNEKFSQFAAAAVPLPGSYIMPFADAGVDNYQATLDDFLASIFDQGVNYTPPPTIFFESGSYVTIQDNYGSSLVLDAAGGIFLFSGSGANLALYDNGDVVLFSLGHAELDLNDDSSVDLTDGTGSFELDGTGNMFLYAQSMSINSVLGFTGTISPVTSITVQCGIVTAVS